MVYEIILISIYPTNFLSNAEMITIIFYQFLER